MLIRGPNPVAGTSRQAAWLRSLWAAVRACRLLPGMGYKVRYTSLGTVLEVEPRGGGAGGGVVLMELISFSFNYLVCRPDGGDPGGADDVNVALQPELRSTITSQSIVTPSGNETWSYGSYNATYQSRVATCEALSETQYITPRFLAGDVIPVQSCGNTGVSVSGTELSRIAITGREWAQEYEEP